MSFDQGYADGYGQKKYDMRTTDATKFATTATKNKMMVVFMKLQSGKQKDRTSGLAFPAGLPTSQGL